MAKEKTEKVSNEEIMAALEIMDKKLVLLLQIMDNVSKFAESQHVVN